MHSRSGRNLCLFAIVTICFLAISHGSPVPDLESDKDANVTDTTTASPLTTITQSVISQGTKGKADKARECALQAIRIIVSDLDGPVDEECRQILKTMTINAGKHKEENNPVDDVDLRKELKEIAQREVQYQNMNDEIDQAENLNAEKRSDSDEKLEEFTSRNDDAALLAMESEKKATSRTKDKQDAVSYNLNSDFKPHYFKNENEKSSDRFTNKDSDVEVFQEGKFIVDDDGIGLLEEPNPSNRNDIDDDFLVIPLRFLRNNMRNERVREHESRNKIAEESREGRMKYGRKNDMAARWLLQSILNMVIGELDDEQMTNAKEDKIDVIGSEDEKSKAQSQIEKAKQDDSALDIEDDINGEGGSDSDSQSAVEHAKEMNTGVLAQVESDIAKLGKDLRRLQFN
ncbi:uncharacterized protein LOC120326670 [Styela clava]